jgi:hypothetical protein
VKAVDERVFEQIVNKADFLEHYEGSDAE